MPRVFDNIELPLLPALQQTLCVSHRADFCVGYFNLRGWKSIDRYVEDWPGGPNAECRLLVGMQKPPQEDLRAVMGLASEQGGMDNQAAIRLKRQMAEEFRNQLMVGIPTNEDEAALRRLANQIRAGKLRVKLFVRHPLHAKLYLCFRQDAVSPIVGFLGSSNLTLAGLSYQGELNVDVLDHDAAEKLSRWFNDRWNDRWCLDISEELVAIIDESWARETPLPPYHIYVKMAYHLSQEARAGLSEFRLPPEFRDRLFDYQTAAVKIAARHLHKRGGVLIGDVVGLGKTLMATAVARIFEDDFHLETLIICPKNLVKMWDDYRVKYRLRGATVLSVTRAIRELPDLPRYRLVVIDESHNLRNREGRTYRAIRDYIEKNESRCVLLSATPYNKTYLDLSSQLRLFVADDKDLGVRPERALRQIGELEFNRIHQCSPRSLAAFEKSAFADDWRELMRLYMVRRTRTFIKTNYAKLDPDSGRAYLTMEDGGRSYFPNRLPQTAKFDIDPQLERLFAAEVVDCVNRLILPRYGMGNYVSANPLSPPSTAEAKVIQDLSRAGNRLKGFARTNLFKRLESSGEAFRLSVQRHILRNHVYLHAFQERLPLPIGTQASELLDTRFEDEDAEQMDSSGDMFEEGVNRPTSQAADPTTETDFQRRAREVYERYHVEYKNRFKWLPAHFFLPVVGEHLRHDTKELMEILRRCAAWNPEEDSKLNTLANLIQEAHPHEKVLVFTQFSDTVHYLERNLKARGVTSLEGVTGKSQDPTGAAWRFSPRSNGKHKEVTPEKELRVVVATDVLSEGQNLQDAHIVVSYDLPWAIIRLIQRCGRVDRIGQLSESIVCYSFLPAEGVEKIIHLRNRVRSRLKENAEVVGTDEAYFEDDRDNQSILDLYHEKSGILDGEPETEVDLASYAYEIWKRAVESDPSLQRSIPELPSVVYSTKRLESASSGQLTAAPGALVYLRTGEGNDALAWFDRNDSSVTESQYAILRAAECAPGTPALPKHPDHHRIVGAAVTHILAEEKSAGGQLGRPSGARFRTYERMKRYADSIAGTLFETTELHNAIDEIYRYPLTQAAADRLNAHLRNNVSDDMLAQLVLLLRAENRLCIVAEEMESREPRIICSLGLTIDDGLPLSRSRERGPGGEGLPE